MASSVASAHLGAVRHPCRGRQAMQEVRRFSRCLAVACPTSLVVVNEKSLNSSVQCVCTYKNKPTFWAKVFGFTKKGDVCCQAHPNCAALSSCNFRNARKPGLLRTEYSLYTETDHSVSSIYLKSHSLISAKGLTPAFASFACVPTTCANGRKKILGGAVHGAAREISCEAPFQRALSTTRSALHGTDTVLIHRGNSSFLSSSLLTATLSSIVDHRGMDQRWMVRNTSSGITTTEGELVYDVEVMVEESFSAPDGLQTIIDALRQDAPTAVQLATDGLEEFDDATTVEVAVLLCDDAYIQGLNKEWLDIDAPTDVLSFPQEQPPGLNPTMLLGDIIISVDTATRQAKERGHTLLDELRILLVHGLLHLIGYDHEKGDEAKTEMAEEEKRIMAALGWKGEGLIEASLPKIKEGGSGQGNKNTIVDGSKAAAAAVEVNGVPSNVATTLDSASKNSPRQKKPPFRYLFCDMDGTLLNSKSQVAPNTAEALRAAKARGVTVVIATGKARPAAMSALSTVGLVGTGPREVVSLESPGVFLQGLRVYGREGAVVHSALLSEDVCAEGFAFADKHRTALIGFSGDRCVTLFDHPLVEALHTIFYEPRAQVMASYEQIRADTPIQKLLFYDTPEGVSDFLRPHWTTALNGRASCTQAVSDMLEILPHGASKGAGVKILLDHLDVPADEIMALGDGENDKEMIEMAGWGVAMANGSPATLAVANAIVRSNDEDGVAEAIEKFILS
eukprot:TRINITY_DN3559_c0_g1_i1.p1 TRINITY_DN3559_c0_g1~~TRINITY_DN3559_c0_g1_i1.p1  ORF type:complete len:759 (-),score=98.35 TRINITY_DN3559_c0_g1_i1:657-2864(-)